MSNSAVFVHAVRQERRVKKGFYWTAFLFGTLWAYSEGLTVIGGRLAAVDAMVGLTVLYGSQTGHPLVAVGALLSFIGKNVYCAIRGQFWLRSLLIQQGYRAL